MTLWNSSLEDYQSFVVFCFSDSSIIFVSNVLVFSKCSCSSWCFLQELWRICDGCPALFTPFCSLLLLIDILIDKLDGTKFKSLRLYSNVSCLASMLIFDEFSLSAPMVYHIRFDILFQFLGWGILIIYMLTISNSFCFILYFLYLFSVFFQATLTSVVHLINII